MGPDFVIEEGELVRMRRPQVGDQIVVNVASHSGLTVGKVMKIANGTGLLVAA